MVEDLLRRIPGARRFSGLLSSGDFFRREHRRIREIPRYSAVRKVYKHLSRILREQAGLFGSKYESFVAGIY